MATAEELLAYETGEVLSVDLNTRVISIPANVKNLGVESDDDVLRLPFTIPRYFGDVDLSGFDIRINYLNANSEGDSYFVQNANIDENSIDFEWLVGRYATAYSGDVRFSICLKKINDENVVEQEFNTTICTLPVLVGLETNEAVIQEYPDVFRQLLSEALIEAIRTGEFKGDKGEKGDTGDSVTLRVENDIAYIS